MHFHKNCEQIHQFYFRSGQRAFSESEAQSIVNTIVPGASITSMSSTGSYTDNPGYHTLRTIHNRHKPVLDFIETGEEHEVHMNGHGSHHGGGHSADHHFHHHHPLKRSDSMNKQRHGSGSGGKCTLQKILLSLRFYVKSKLKGI